jgi:curved DNA-binding protein CbpA
VGPSHSLQYGQRSQGVADQVRPVRPAFPILGDLKVIEEKIKDGIGQHGSEDEGDPPAQPFQGRVVTLFPPGVKGFEAENSEACTEKERPSLDLGGKLAGNDGIDCETGQKCGNDTAQDDPDVRSFASKCAAVTHGESLLEGL